MGRLTPRQNLQNGPRSILARGKFGAGHPVFTVGKSHVGEDPIGPQAESATIWRSYGVHVYEYPYYWPTNPRSASQQSRRGVFASAVSSWQGLSPESKAWWRAKHKTIRCRQRMSAYNYYLSEYMKEHAPGG
jgi:hypothetical protein